MIASILPMKNQAVEALSQNELCAVAAWIEHEKSALPAEIHGFLIRLLAVYGNLILGALRAKQTLARLREAMGISPKSERGSQKSKKETESIELTMQPEWSSEERENFLALQKKRAALNLQRKEYDQELKALRGKLKVIGPQLELNLAKPNEMLFSFPLAFRENRAETRKVDRMQEFEKTKGLHAASDYPKRMEIKVVATEITYQVETVTDPETGKSVRASVADDGPEGFQVTWGALATLAKLHVGFAIPIHRMVLMIGQPEFSSSKICRLLQYMAISLKGVYLTLADQLSDASLLSGDDTPTKVLETAPTGPDALCDAVDAQFGWIQPRVAGGDKKAVNVSLIVGRTEPDPRSTIRFFRTHIGSVGNLLSKILESRSPKAGPLIFQGDLSTSNLPNEAARANLILFIAGCAAHARRPFWRFRADDEQLCYFMLRCFLFLSKLETLIDERGRTRENVLRMRGRYGLMMWKAMRNRCIAATTGTIAGPATYPRGITPDVWPPNTELNKAANYVINHFEELTLYLDHPELAYTNNAQERALRVEKCMLSSSKFRKTKRGRVTLDILRTINATCTAANVDLTDYLRFAFKHLHEFHDHPERLTPFAFAKSLQKAPPAITMPSA